MASIIMIKCPTTGQAISTGIHIERVCFNKMANTLSRSHCPVCGNEHGWWKTDAWLAQRPSVYEQAHTDQTTVGL